MLKLMYITNDVNMAKILEKNGVDRVWVDLEKLGKSDRQGGMNTVQSSHTIEDVQRIRNAISGKSELMVRINPINPCSVTEIEEVIAAGADVIMLPYYKTIADVDSFINAIRGRVKACLLLETIGAEQCLDETLRLYAKDIDEIHIGLNDLHLEYKMKFMFELLSNGKVEDISSTIKKYGIPFGFGGIAKLDEGLLPARHVIAEHYRLGSSMAILSRSFYDHWISDDYEEIDRVFKFGIEQIRDYEQRLAMKPECFFENNRKRVVAEVSQVVGTK